MSLIDIAPTLLDSMGDTAPAVFAEVTPLDSETRERMRALGYGEQ